MSLPITTILTSLLALLFVRLSLQVVRLRQKNQVSLGDGDHEDLRRAIRGQGNCAEYAPIGVLLVLVAELQSAHGMVSTVIAVLAAAFLLGRVLHGYAFAFTTGNMKLRVRGMQLTILTIIALAAFNLLMPAIAFVAPGMGYGSNFTHS